MSDDAAVCNELSRPACLHPPQPSAMAGGMIGTRAGRIASREIFTHTNLSADLRKRSLAFGTFLGAPRYVVHARSQRAKAEAARPRQDPPPHTRPWQRYKT
jgi:hypothetical protein